MTTRAAAVFLCAVRSVIVVAIASALCLLACGHGYVRDGFDPGIAPEFGPDDDSGAVELGTGSDTMETENAHMRARAYADRRATKLVAEWSGPTFFYADPPQLVEIFGLVIGGVISVPAALKPVVDIANILGQNLSPGRLFKKFAKLATRRSVPALRTELASTMRADIKLRLKPSTARINADKTLSATEKKALMICTAQSDTAAAILSIELSGVSDDRTYAKHRTTALGRGDHARRTATQGQVPRTLSGVPSAV